MKPFSLLFTSVHRDSSVSRKNYNSTYKISSTYSKPVLRNNLKSQNSHLISNKLNPFKSTHFFSSTNKEIVIGDQTLGKAVLSKATDLSKSYFGKDLLACYALGSLAHGGFSPFLSDVDFAVILNDPFKDEYNAKIAQVKADITTSGLPLAERISIFWSTYESLKNNLNIGRFPPYDKLDLIKHGLVLYGSDVRSKFPTPTKQDLEVDGIKFFVQFLSAEKIKQINNLDNLIAQGEVLRFAKLILFPIRLLYTARTGLLAHNEIAVKYYIENENSIKSELVKLAFKLRSTPPHERNNLLNQDNNLILLSSKIVLLIYKEFIEVYQAKMLEYHEKDLADQLLDRFNQLFSKTTPEACEEHLSEQMNSYILRPK